MNKFLITMQHNESFFLPIFLRHYSQYFDPKNIFIIDHGSEKNLIPPEFNRIYIPRDKPFSEVNRLDFIKEVSNSLLRYYDVGIFADTDELIYLKEFKWDSINLSSPIQVAGFDCTVLQVDGKQKLLGIATPFECKALIFSKVPDWAIGFHSVVNLEIPDDFNIPMAHLKYFSTIEFNIRNLSRQSTYEKMSAFEKDKGVAMHWNDPEHERYNFINVVASSLEKYSIKSFTPVKSESFFTRMSLGGFDGNQPSDFIYLPKEYLWDPTTVTDLTNYFPQLVNAEC